MSVYAVPGSPSVPVFWEWPIVKYFNRKMAVKSDYFNPGDEFTFGVALVNYSVADEYGVILTDDFTVEVKG